MSEERSLKASSAVDLTADQSWAVSRLRRAQRSWRWVRWLHLAFGTIAFAAAVIDPRLAVSDFLPSGAGQDTVLTALSVGMFSFFLTQLMFFGLLGLYLAMRAVVNWRGAPETILLLRLFCQC